MDKRERLISLFIIVFLTFPAHTIFSETKRITFIHPTSKNNTYWPQVVRVMKAAAKDLDMEISAHGFDVNNRYKRHVEGIRIIRQKPRPDAVIFSIAFGNARPFLEAAEKENIPVLLQGQLFPSELAEIGSEPRKKFRMWIGHFCQDETKKGYILGKILLSKAHAAKRYTNGGLLHVVGIGGDYTWYGSKLRMEGLLKAVAEDKKAKLLQVVPTKWTPEEAVKKTSQLLNRYNGVSVIWAASDQLAIGVCDALKIAGKVQGKDIFTGGLDLSEAGLLSVSENKISATVASSMILYSEVLVYLNDYLMGIDFKDEVGTKIYTGVYSATKKNVKKHLLLSRNYMKINFKKFSKAYNKNLKKYDFSFEKIVKSLN